MTVTIAACFASMIAIIAWLAARHVKLARAINSTRTAAELYAEALEIAGLPEITLEALNEYVGSNLPEEVRQGFRKAIVSLEVQWQHEVLALYPASLCSALDTYGNTAPKSFVITSSRYDSARKSIMRIRAEYKVLMDSVNDKLAVYSHASHVRKTEDAEEQLAQASDWLNDYSNVFDVTEPLGEIEELKRDFHAAKKSILTSECIPPEERLAEIERFEALIHHADEVVSFYEEALRVVREIEQQITSTATGLITRATEDGKIDEAARIAALLKETLVGIAGKQGPATTSTDLIGFMEGQLVRFNQEASSLVAV